LEAASGLTPVNCNKGQRPPDRQRKPLGCSADGAVAGASVRDRLHRIADGRGCEDISRPAGDGPPTGCVKFKSMARGLLARHGEPTTSKGISTTL
jgi:hypothetical protein